MPGLVRCLLMDGEVQVGSFGAPVDAELARSLLESHDISCRISDDILVGAALHMESALGGVKLFVSTGDAQRAAQLLDEHQRALKEDRRAEETADARIARAWRSAIIGLFLFPGGLHLWSLWLLLRTPYSQVARASRARYWTSVLLDVAVLASVGYFVATVWLFQ